MILEIRDSSSRGHRLGEGSAAPRYAWIGGWEFTADYASRRALGNRKTNRIRVTIEDDRITVDLEE